MLALREISACDAKTAALDLAQARERLDQLRLAVAVDAGDADDLSGTYLERHPANGLELPLVQDVEVIDLEQGLRRCRGRLLDPQEHVAPDHQPRQPLLGRTGRAAASRSSCHGGAP